MDKDLKDDLIVGATALAEYIFGDPKQRRRIYYLAEIGALPLFNIGASLAGRKSTLAHHIEKKERAGLKQPA